MALGNFLQGFTAAQDRNAAAGTRQIQEYGVLQRIIAQQQAAQLAEKQAQAQQQFRTDELGLKREALTGQRDATAAQRELTRETNQARLAEQQAAREQRATDAAENRRLRMDEIRMRLSESSIAREERAALQREMALMKAANSPEMRKKEEKVEGKRLVSETLSKLREDYEAYEKIGADIDPSRNFASNIVNRVASSSIGQAAGGAIGSQEQTIRDQINAKRAMLMAALKQATGMGATQLNSDRELQFYLNMATDPSRGRAANKEALDHLEKTYGLGGAQSAPNAPAAAPPAGLTPQEQQELDALRQRFGR